MRMALCLIVLLLLALLSTGCSPAMPLATPRPTDLAEPLLSLSSKTELPKLALRPMATPISPGPPEPTATASSALAPSEFTPTPVPGPTSQFNTAAFGQIAHNDVQRMREGYPTWIQALLRRDAGPAAAETLKEELTAPGTPVVQPLRVTHRMLVELKGDPRDFDIRPIHSSAIQAVDTEQSTDWSWWVTPNRPGAGKILHLRATQIEERIEGGRTITFTRDVPEKVIELTVDVDPIHSAGRLAQVYGWIVGLAVFVALGALLAPRLLRDRREKAALITDTGGHGYTPAELETMKKLRYGLIKHFDLGEIRGLCADLGINYEILDGEGLEDKALGLVEYACRHTRLDDLVDAYRKARPNVPW